MNNLGEAYRELGRFEEAITCYQQSLAILREIDDRRFEGQALNNLGLAYQQLGRFEEAITSTSSRWRSSGRSVTGTAKA